MTCWQPLKLTEIQGQGIPLLLIKPCFSSQSYAVFVTDLSNIWCEELQLDAITERAADEESPIDVSHYDVSQLDILLGHVRASLTDTHSASRRITRSDSEGITLHTTAELPGSLGQLNWKFHLQKKISRILKDELILPLLMSAHVQHERTRNLLSVISEKDRAISRMIDQFESSGLDLAAAFPSLGGSKPGRRTVKREQAARQIPGLRAFDKNARTEDLDQVTNGQIASLDLFQEALSECPVTVPAPLMSTSGEDSWWTSINSKEELAHARANPRIEKTNELVRPPVPASDDESETEDEFEVHENFKLREAAKQEASNKAHVVSAPVTRLNEDIDTATEDEDEVDLDAQPKRQSQGASNQFSRPAATVPSNRSPSAEVARSPPKKSKGFRIGGVKPRETASLSPAPLSPQATVETNAADVEMDDAPPAPSARAATGTPKTKRTFKIGGRNREATVERDEQIRSPSSKPGRPHGNPSEERSLTAKSAGGIARMKEPTPDPAIEEHEETAEERADRKRTELKRKNDELAKQQAQKKKKKRF